MVLIRSQLVAKRNVVLHLGFDIDILRVQIPLTLRSKELVVKALGMVQLDCIFTVLEVREVFVLVVWPSKLVPCITCCRHFY